ncbi:aldo/keto reductase [Tumebacillus permanentifrigoris]|uniref:Putative oxidoreductase n=1 Tax=Tumebacillus permanentifrigoris TaxID=378543 RepID=A0A316DBY8_9BACL|nr:aldo/keto reductase [Tumebacillus permanentifrigoris]PWK15657.1 putative oxidoreductase [Tumebacillus permanentifrigoris]
MTAQTIRTTTLGPNEIEVSALALGCMGLAGTWDPEEFSAEHLKRGITALEAAVEAGITFYDHADIYGRTMSESVFGEFLDLNPGLRERLFLATKCGIILGDEQTPYHYNLSKSYILESAHGSLKRLQTDYIDLYQIHRPDPHTHPRETAEALNQLVRDGVARSIGVSNHLPAHVQALQAYLDVPIVSTQPSISLWNQETMDNGVLAQCLEKNIRPLAYSPLGGGVLAGKNLESVQDDLRLPKLLAVFETLGEKYNATPAQLSLAWLMQHPAGIIPLFGSNNPDNIREAAEATRLHLSHEDWYILWAAGREKPLP